MNKKCWEYQICDVNMWSKLEELGNDGWEMFTIYNGECWFKKAYWSSIE